MKKLEQLIIELENKIPQQKVVNNTVSKGSVGWHIEHTLLTFNLIIEALKKSNPADYKWKFSFTKLLVFTMNKIPRGKAKAPSVVQPKNDFDTNSLKRHVINAKEKLKELDSLQSNNYFGHPFFGKLNLKPSKKFLVIHTQHHLNIINDIVKSEK